jgi:hypothetical protein
MNCAVAIPSHAIDARKSRGMKMNDNRNISFLANSRQVQGQCNCGTVVVNVGN